MNTYKNDVIAVFQNLASQLGLSASEPSGSFVEIVGAEIGLRIRWQIDRIEGIFVTLYRIAEPNSEYSITYLIEYMEGTPQEIETSKLNDAGRLATLVEKYAVVFLLGTPEEFKVFEEYAKSRILEKTPETPELNTTKWVRSEWT